MKAKDASDGKQLEDSFPKEQQLWLLPNTQQLNQHLSQQHLLELENKTKERKLLKQQECHTRD